jgi:hypothetical protein
MHPGPRDQTHLRSPRPFDRRWSRKLRVHDAVIEEHSNGPVPGESSLEMLVEMCAVAGDDNELPNCLRWVVVPFRCRVTAPRITRRRGLRQEPRERGPRRAPAGWARRGANAKALVAIETQRERPQGEMRRRREHSSTAGHRRVTSGTGRGMSEPVLATVTSLSYERLAGLRGRGPLNRLTSS